MQLSREKFCGLSRSRDFQSFLLNNDRKLYTDLINHLQLGEGCQSNKRKMIEIYDEIKKNVDLNGKLEIFLRSNHPNVIINDNSSGEQKLPDKVLLKVEARTIDELHEKMNYHKVFDVYRPSVLSIPQRKIILGNTYNEVNNMINRFLANKVYTDHIILEGDEMWHGYVEYFDLRFAEEAKKVDHSRRPISIYRKMHPKTEDHI